MSLSQWKLLSQIRDSVSKFSNDKSLQNVFGKDITQIIQKIPSNISNETLKYFNSYTQSAKLTKNVKAIIGRASSTIPSTLTISTPKNKDKVSEEVVYKWQNRDLVLQCSISSQTQHVMSSILSAENEESLLNRIETLTSHIKQFPEERNSIIRTGAVSHLLQIRRRTQQSGDIQAALRETLALLGYSDPVTGDGIRILSIDGGGIRGLLVLEMLKKLEELTGRKVHELFDLFCGVSTGAILALSIGIHHKDLDEIAEGYKRISMEVFKQSAIWGTGNLVLSQAYYDTTLWEKNLRDHLGCDSLISTTRDPKCPKLCAVSAVVNQSRLSAYVFRNYSLPWKVKSQYFGSNQHEVWEAARASAAAPTYFEEFKLGSFIHQDGGILVNNPTAVALHEAKLIWPNTPIQCVVSFGTGRSVPSPTDFVYDSQTKSSSTSWANKFYKLLDSATDTEGVHIMLNDLLPGNVYYRFNPYLTEMVSMVEINPQKLEQLKRDAIMYLRRNEVKFEEAAQVLTKDKSLLRKTKDFVRFRRDLYGL